MTKEDVESASDADTNPVDDKSVEATDEVESTADEAPSLDDSDKASDKGWLRYAAAGAVSAILVGALVFSGVVGWKVWRQHQIDVAGEQAQAVAISYTEI